MGITKYNTQLPANIEDLSRFVLVGREKLVAVRAEIRAIDKLNLANEVKEQKREEATYLAEALLDAETRIGELLQINKPQSQRDDYGRFTEGSALPDGISKNQSSQYQQMAEHRDVIEHVKAEAKEKDKLPTRSEVIRKIHEKHRQERNEELKNNPVVLPDEKYRIIYADPPWQYNDFGVIEDDNYGRAERHYPTMNIQALSEFGEKIIGITEKDAVLFLWTTSPMLEDAFIVINAWGFKYKTSFIWDKIKHNFGHYNSVRHELLLICTKGSCVPDNPKLYDSVQSIEKKDIHSSKPEEFRQIIDTLYTHGRKIELFARVQTKGWDVWGNQAGDNIDETA